MAWIRRGTSEPWHEADIGRRAVILGSGFSRAISDYMPTTLDLARETVSRLEGVDALLPPDFGEASEFEAWLSALAEAQPFLDEAENLRNRALFVSASSAIRDILLGFETLAMRDAAPPSWLRKWIYLMQHFNATVATFNYDLLVERAVESCPLWDKEGNRVRGRDLIGEWPPTAEPPRGGWSIPPLAAASFTLLKLHGSLDTFWTLGDASGASVARWEWESRWGDPRMPDDVVRRRSLPGREPYLIPPTATKSGFYANPLAREVWQTAYRALASAHEITFVGYSLPITDMVSAAMVSRALTDEHLVVVVNPAPDPVLARLKSLGVSEEQVTIFTDCETWIDSLENCLRPTLSLDGEVATRLPPVPDALGLAVGVQNNWYEVEAVDAVADTEALLTVGPRSEVLASPPEQPAVTLDTLQHRFAALERVAVKYPDGSVAAIATSKLQNSVDGLGYWFTFEPTAVPRPHA